MNTIPQPSTGSLVLSFVFSIILASIILVIAVLPAEYNIDPTGLGEKMGLTVLAKVVDTTAKANIVDCSDVDALSNKSVSQWNNTVSITIPAHKGLEYKFHIDKGEVFEFVWKTNGAKLYFDFHGEPQGDTTGYFKSFKESTDNQSSGALSVPFTGSHGWYWENKSNQAVVVNLKTRGSYRILGLR